jgi:uncharacterized membrane protein YeiB
MPLIRPEGVAMTTAIPLTLHLLILIGLYELAAGLAGLTGAIDWPAMLEEFDRSPALSFMTGFMVYALGATVTLVHHHWTDLPAIIVSLIGWIALIEGLMIMVMPAPLMAFSRKLVANQRFISIFATLFGVALILLGLTGRADPTLI